jgi:hypothetical protein
MVVDYINPTVADPLAARTLIVAGHALGHAERFVAASLCGEKAVAAAHATGDDVLTADALVVLGLNLSNLRDARAIGHLDQAVRYARSAGNRRALADALWARGYGSTYEDSSGRPVGRAASEASLELLRPDGDLCGMGWALSTLAIMAMSDRDFADVRRYLDEFTDLNRQLGDRPAMGTGEVNLGLLTVALREHDAAGRHFTDPSCSDDHRVGAGQNRRRLARLGEAFDRAMTTGGVGESAVSGHEGHVQHLGQRHVRGVVHGEVGPKLPATIQ